jgi:hypothetical protein
VILKAANGHAPQSEPGKGNASQRTEADAEYPHYPESGQNPRTGPQSHRASLDLNGSFSAIGNDGRQCPTPAVRASRRERLRWVESGHPGGAEMKP